MPMQVYASLIRRSTDMTTPRKTKSRWQSRPLKGRGRSRSILPYDHAAVAEGRTIYPSTVQVLSGVAKVLMPGANERKIGGMIRKGKWSGFPVFTLTLPERTSCARSCFHWESCYGNHMHRAKRMPPGAELERRLRYEVALLAKKYPAGFAIRLSVLGDFYSVEFVALWRRLLARHPQLHIFGMTACWNVNDDELKIRPIAAALIALSKEDNWHRFRMLYSNAPDDFPLPERTVSVLRPSQAPADAIVCPEQLGQTESCSTCGLCWNRRGRIALIQH
jgi:hypothetical protein